jgi:hypothetical protein
MVSRLPLFHKGSHLPWRHIEDWVVEIRASEPAGGGVYVTGSGTVTMNDGTIGGNSASYGGGGRHLYQAIGYYLRIRCRGLIEKHRW